MADAIEWVKLELHVAAAVDESIAVPEGIVLTTLADLGDTQKNRRKLYELNAECSADIPGRGPFHSWEDYQRLRLDIASFDPAGVTLALDGADWVGMSALSVHPHLGICFQEMTGVRAAYRRRGLAMAMKLHTLDFARACQAQLICTVNDPRNTAMIDLNRRVGFTDADWDYPPAA